jgi:hypothetical protein
MVGVKWSTAVQHVELAAQACARMAELPPSLVGLRVRQLWAAGEILGAPRDLEWTTVVLVADLPVAEVPWWSVPPGGQGWLDSTRLSKYPVLTWWRSLHAPVWNHRVVRPLLVWDEASGVIEEAVAALREGRGAAAGLPEPSTQQLAARLAEELAVSLAGLRASTSEFDRDRWRRGGMAPAADALWRAADGYLDVLDARTALGAV